MSSPPATTTTRPAPKASATGEGSGAMRRGGPAGNVAVVAFLVLIMLWTLIPLLWMVMSSFKSSVDVTASTPKVVFDPTTENYTNLFSGANDLTPYLWHSIVAAGLSALLSLVIGTLAGYGLSRSTMRGKHHLSFWIISTRMAPIAAVILPLFLMFRIAGLIDTLPGLILAYMTFNLPFAIWLMSAFFSDVPPSIEESALVAGASRWQAFWHVVLPLSKAGLVTTGVLCLVFAWNDYMFATVFSGPSSQTLPIAASQLVTQTGIDWGQLTAIGTIVVLPMILAGLAVRRWLVTGLTLGAVTGE
jgi:multiple sugar transport system permease protein